MERSPGWRRGRPLRDPPLRPEDAGLRLLPARTRPAGIIVWTAFPEEPRGTHNGEQGAVVAQSRTGGQRLPNRRAQAFVVVDTEPGDTSSGDGGTALRHGRR